MKRLQKIGTVLPKKSGEIGFSRLGIGFEKLDRAVFDPEKAYDLVAGTGVKYARIQSGWMRTEKEKGKYDFAWIDPIIDNLLARGIEPWINLVYGNPIYTEIAKDFFGAVGCPPTEGEELAGWLSYVKALVTHTRGRVNKFEIWNEPDIPYSWKRAGNVTGTTGIPDGKEYGEFAKATAVAIREADENAYVIGFAIGHAYDFHFLHDAMETGLGDVLDAVSYHGYLRQTRKRIRMFESLSAIVHAYNPKLEIVQGESGTQSEYSFAGAHRLMDWTPEKQAKHLLRLMVTDLSLGCRFVSYFSAMDMVEALNGLLSDKKTFMDYGFFGVISADFDENGVASGEYKPKESYRALQTLTALLSEDAVPETVPHWFKSEVSRFVGASDYDGQEILTFGFRLADGSALFTYWRDTDILTTSYKGTTTAEFFADTVPELIDLRDGSVYAFPDSMVEQKSGYVKLINLPLCDYPLALRFKK